MDSGDYVETVLWRNLGLSDLWLETASHHPRDMHDLPISWLRPALFKLACKVSSGIKYKSPPSWKAHSTCILSSMLKYYIIIFFPGGRFGKQHEKAKQEESIRKELQNDSPGTQGSFLQEIPSLKCLSKTPSHPTWNFTAGTQRGLRRVERQEDFFLSSFTAIVNSSQVVLINIWTSKS